MTFLDLSTPDALAAVAGRRSPTPRGRARGSDRPAPRRDPAWPRGSARRGRAPARRSRRAPARSGRRGGTAGAASREPRRAVPAVFAALRGAIADQRVRATAISGTGTAGPVAHSARAGNDLLITSTATASRRQRGRSRLISDRRTPRRALAPRQRRTLRPVGGHGGVPSRHACPARAFRPRRRAAVTRHRGSGRLGRIARDRSDVGAGTGVRVLPTPRRRAHWRFRRADGHSAIVSMPTAVWHSTPRAGDRQQLVGALAARARARANLPWLDRSFVVPWLGWAPGARLARHSSLSIAALVADPEAELAGFGRALIPARMRFARFSMRSPRC